MDQEQLQALADELVWYVAEGHEMLERVAFRNLGVAKGWNAAMRVVAEALELEVNLKTFDERLKVIEPPSGHEDFTWTPPAPGGSMGTYTCQCGHIKRCTNGRVLAHHTQHRHDLASRIIREALAKNEIPANN